MATNRRSIYGRRQCIPRGVDGGCVEFCLRGREKLINILMCVANKKEAQVDLLKHIKADEEREKC